MVINFSAGLQNIIPNLKLSENITKKRYYRIILLNLNIPGVSIRILTFRKVSEAVINNEQQEMKSWFGDEGLKGNIQIDSEYDEKLFNDFISSYEEYIKKDEEPTQENIAEAIQKIQSTSNSGSYQEWKEWSCRA